jgi:hypothetical protein
MSWVDFSTIAAARRVAATVRGACPRRQAAFLLVAASVEPTRETVEAPVDAAVGGGRENRTALPLDAAPASPYIACKELV